MYIFILNSTVCYIIIFSLFSSLLLHFLKNKKEAFSQPYSICMGPLIFNASPRVIKLLHINILYNRIQYLIVIRAPI